MRGAGDRRRRVGVGHFLGQPLRGRAAARVAEKIEDIDQARAGNNSLVADMAETSAKIVEQLHFHGFRGAKSPCPPSLAKTWCRTPSQIHSSFAQPSARRDHRLIADRMSLYVIQRNYILGLERGNAPGVGFEIVNQKCFS